MFCKTCGQQVDETLKFCPTCGAKIEAPTGYAEPTPASEPAPAYNPGYAAPTYNPGYAAPVAPATPAAPAAPAGSIGATGFNALGSNVILFFISVGVLLTNIIFMYCPVMTASYYYRTESFGLFAGEETNGFFIFVGILQLMGYLAAMALCMLPIMTNKTWTSKHFLCGRITCMVTVSMFLLFWIIMAAGTPSRYSVYLSFWGWMFLLGNIGGIVLSFVVPSMLNKKPAAPAPAAPAYNPPQY